MSQPPPLRAWLAFAAVGALTTPGEIHAQERTAAAVGEREGIAGAKKELESLRSAREAALLPASGLPRVDIPAPPALQQRPVSIPQAVPPSGAKSKSAETRSGNWLLEAMEQGEKSRNSSGDAMRSRDRKGKASLRREKSDDADEERKSAAEVNDEERRTGPVAVNPLARYIDEWMSPQDYALLKPGAFAPFDSRVESNQAGTLGISSLGGAPGGLNELMLPGMSSAPPALPPPPRENPYLQTLKPDLTRGVVAPPAKPVVVPPVRTAPPPLVSPPAAAPAQTNIPDFAKPPADEKHFKQLKRF